VCGRQIRQAVAPADREFRGGSVRASEIGGGEDNVCYGARVEGEVGVPVPRVRDSSEAVTQRARDWRYDKVGPRRQRPSKENAGAERMTSRPRGVGADPVTGLRGCERKQGSGPKTRDLGPVEHSSIFLLYFHFPFSFLLFLNLSLNFKFVMNLYSNFLSI
jgi:hypothetical protein